MTPTSDEGASSFAEVLRRAKDGEEDAVEQLFARLADEDREGKAIFAMARRILPSGDRAREFVESRDLIQSALRSGWVHLDAFRGETPAELMGWMRAILRRKLGRVVRRKEVRDGARKAADLDGAKADDEEEPIVRLIREEVRERVRQAIRRLPDDQRAVLELRLEGLDAPQIAVMLCLKPETVRKRESRAAGRLREILGAAARP